MPKRWPEKCIINSDMEQPNNSLQKGLARSTADLNHLILISTTAFLFTIPEEGLWDVRHDTQQGEILFFRKIKPHTNTNHVFSKDVTSSYKVTRL